MINSGLQGVLNNLVDISERIDSVISIYSSRESSDEDYFIYHFSHRSLLFGKSFILLVESQFFHEATLIARNLLEGLFYFQAYRFQIINGIPRKWRLFGIYEDYRMTKEEDRGKLLSDFRKMLGSEIVEEVQKEYDFGKQSQNWFGYGTSKELAKDIDKKLTEKHGCGIGMLSLYDSLYHDFSQITHWTPQGIIIGQRNINAALAVSIQSLHTIAEYVNSKYKLSYDKDLGNILVKFFKIGQAELMRKINSENI